MRLPPSEAGSPRATGYHIRAVAFSARWGPDRDSWVSAKWYTSLCAAHPKRGRSGRIKAQLRTSSMKPSKSAAIVLALIGVIFLVPWVKQAINGEPLGLTPALAAAIGLFLGAV